MADNITSWKMSVIASTTDGYMGIAEKEPLQLPFRSQNWGRARTDTNEPLARVPTTLCLLMWISVAPAAAFCDTVKVWPSTKSNEFCGTAPGSGFTEIWVWFVPESEPLSEVTSGWPAITMLGSSGGRSSLLTKPPFSVIPALKL